MPGPPRLTHNAHMFLLKKLLSALALPPAGPLLLALAGLVLARRHPRTGRGVVAVSLLTLTALSLPVIGDGALRSLEAPYAAVGPEQLAQAQAIVILAGGTYYDAPEYGGDTVAPISLVRSRYGAKLAHETGLPVLVTGGSVFRGRPEARSMEALLTREFRVPVRFVEDVSRDTRENARFSARMLREAGITRIALVSHAFHMRRAVPLFEAEGLTVIPAPTAYTTGGSGSVLSWLPSAGALRNSAIFFHEWLGRLFA